MYTKCISSENDRTRPSPKASQHKTHHRTSTTFDENMTKRKSESVTAKAIAESGV